MGLGWTGRASWKVTAILCGLVFTYAPIASAYTLYYVGTLLPAWLIVCNDGFSTYSPGGSVGGSMQYAEVVCDGHGGIAPIDDSDVLDALSLLEPNDPPSAVTFAKDLGAAGHQPLTLAELEVIIAGSSGQPVELTDYEPVSIGVGGRELLPSPVTGLASLPLLEIYSNEDDLGVAVGGVAAAQPLPMGDFAAAWTTILIGSTGVAALVIHRRRWIAARCRATSRSRG